MLSMYQSLLAFAVGILTETAFVDGKEVVKTPYSCNHPDYDVHIFSKDPLVIYISGFISTEESQHVQAST
jgi:hypothetical protein